MNDVSKARSLIEDFERKTSSFAGLDDLANALDELSEVLDTSQDDSLKQVARNVLFTCKKNILSRARQLLTAVDEHKIEELAYWLGAVKVLDEGIPYGFKNEEEITSLSKTLSRHKQDAEEETLSNREKALRMENNLKSLTEEDKAELRRLIMSKSSRASADGIED